MDPQLPKDFGIGMRSMRLRVEQLGGSLAVLNGQGITLHVHLPGLGSTERSIG
jgi:signal transduction histidine kinase